MRMFFFEEDNSDVNNYHKIIFNIKKLTEELKIKNLNQIFFLVLIMLKNGYFSVNKKYFYKNKDLYNCIPGMHVFLGYGVCRHDAGFLCSLFNVMDLETSVVSLCVKDRYFDFSNEVNHVSTGVLLDDAFMIYDLTNDAITQVFNNYYLHTYLHKPYLKATSKTKEELGKITIQNEKIKYTEAQIMIEKKKSFDIYDQNFKLMNDFYSDNQENYKDIDRLVRKKYWKY